MTALPVAAADTAIDPVHDLEAVAARAAELARQACAPNTIRTYEADWRDFVGWCATRGFDPLPAAPAVVGLYLADSATSCRSRSSPGGGVSSLAARHRRAGLGLDVRHPAVASVLGACAVSAAPPSVVVRSLQSLGSFRVCLYRTNEMTV